MSIEINPIPYSTTKFYSGTYKPLTEQLDFNIAVTNDENLGTTLIEVNWLECCPDDNEINEVQCKIIAHFEDNFCTD